MVLKPVQQPHPPIWYAVLAPDATYWAALEKANIVTLLPPEPARVIVDRFKLEWKKLHGDAQLPLMEVTRHVVLANTTADAMRIAERAYRSWLNHMEILWVQNGTKLPLGLPPEIGPLLAARAAFAGTASEFNNFLDDQIRSMGINYFVCDVAFGNLTLDKSMQTVKLLGEEIIPNSEILISTMTSWK